MPKSGRSSGAKYLVFAFTIVLMAIIIGAAMVVSQPESKPKVTDYLEIVHTISLGEFYNQNRTVKITTLGLNITTVGGEANSIIIQVASQEESEFYQHLNKGETWTAPLLLKGLRTNLNGDGLFPVRIRIGCTEATWEYVWLYLEPGKITDLAEEESF